jgi:hypothetical protein
MSDGVQAFRFSLVVRGKTGESWPTRLPCLSGDRLRAGSNPDIAHYERRDH